MIGRLSALILLCTLSQSTDNNHMIPLTVAKLGDNVTLTCEYSGDEVGLAYWYKLMFGYMIQTVAGGSHFTLSLTGQFDNSRFAVKKVNDQIFLNINNVSKEDEATYFCQIGAAYDMKFINGTVLVVNDHKNQQKSVYVKQIPETASVQLGGSLSLQCSLLSKSMENGVQCPDEQNVFWFRSGSGESHPSIIYTHKNSTDEQEKRSCVYSLSKTIRDSSDRGTYYCAVVQCGKILFSEGTKVETREEEFPFVIVLGSLLAGCVIVIVALIISRNQKPVCVYCKEATTSHHAEYYRSAEDEPATLEVEAENYVALDFISRKRDRRTTNRDFPQDCVYSGMRVDTEE